MTTIALIALAVIAGVALATIKVVYRLAMKVRNKAESIAAKAAPEPEQPTSMPFPRSA